MADEKAVDHNHYFKYKTGNIVGEIIEKRSMSIKQAKSHANELVDCIGFSFLSAKKPNNELNVRRMHFKAGDGFVAHHDHWNTYLCPKVDEIDVNHIQVNFKVFKKKNMTFEDAKLYALKLPNCVGFTYKTNEKTQQKMILFKCYDVTIDHDKSDDKSDDKWESHILTKQTLQTPRTILSHCLVISICIQEYGKLGANDRIGCDIDAKNIDNIFGKNGYQYKIIQNERKYFGLNDYNEMIKEIKRDIVTNCNGNYNKYDALLCFVSAHGKYDMKGNHNSFLCLSDGNKITINDFLDNFRNNEIKGIGDKFIGKSKMFFIEACCGYKTLQLIETIGMHMPLKYSASFCTGIYGSYMYDNNYNNNNDEEKCAYFCGDSYNVHVDEDIILLQSNTNGYQHYVNTLNGSYLITQTINALSKHNQIISLNDAIDEIKYNLKNNKNANQIVVFTSSSVNQIYFDATDKIFLHSIGDVDDVISPGPSDLFSHFIQQIHSFSNEDELIRRTVEIEQK